MKSKAQQTAAANATRAMVRAWQIKRQYDVMYNGKTLFSECLKMAWAETRSERLVDMLRVGVVWFTFMKVDGSIRRACGTLCPTYLPESDDERTETRRRQNETVQVYYDLERQEFRCYKKQNLLSIEIDNE